MNELIPIPTQEPTVGLSLVHPVARPDELIVFHEEVTQLIQKALKEGIDYGAIPGTGDKPTLLKPGAERLNLAFGASPDYEVTEREVDHDRLVQWSKRKKKWNNKTRDDRSFTWEQEDGTSLGIYRYVTKCRLIRQDGRVLATGIGSCSTMESKYIDRPRDCENTVLKMAQKRAYVAATLNAYGLSNRFTQDVEDQHGAPPPRRNQADVAAYTGTPAQEQFVKDFLKKSEVPEELIDRCLEIYRTSDRPTARAFSG